MIERVLVFGSTGQLGAALRRAEWPKSIEPVFLDRAAADFSRPAGLAPIVRRFRPDAIIVAAAYTEVDRAETEEALATTVNAEAPAAISAAAEALGAPVIHISTDYVFDGAKDEPYDETDAVGPLGAYGRSKLAGEIAVRNASSHHLILRTSWLYGAAGSNFLRTMLRLAATRDEVRVVADQRGCPTAASDLAQAIVRLIPMLSDGRPQWGTYHVAGASETSWHGFAEGIFAALSKRGLKRPRNIAIETRDYPTPARRPANSRLSGGRINSVYGVQLSGWQDSLPRVLDESLAEA